MAATISTGQTIPHFLQREADNVIYLSLFSDAQPATPVAGCTVSVYDASGATIVDAGDVTEGLPSSYTIPAATLPDTVPFSERWVIEWSGSYAGNAFLIREDAHLCLRKISPVITEASLLQRHFDLAKLRPSGRASWQPEIDEAWIEIVARLISQGQMPYLTMNPWAFREAHMFMALAIIFREISTHAAGAGSSGGGKYAGLATYYAEAAGAAWSRMNLIYDTSQEGMAGSADAAQATPVVMLTTGARGSGGWRRW